MGGPARVLGKSSGVLGMAWGVLGGAWRVLGGAWRVLGAPWEVPGRHSVCLWMSLGVLGGSSGGPRGSLGGLGGSQNRRCFFRASREGPGELLGWFWCSGVVLGSILGSLNVAISLILVMF